MTDDFLRQRHAAYQTPEGTLNSLVEEMTGQTALAYEPIVRGYENEVYRVRTTGPDQLVVRIQQHGVVGFAQEAWAMSRCRAVGVPVPHVYGVSRIRTADQQREAMVMQHAPGRVLSQVMADLSRRQRVHLFAQVGAALHAMHTIPVGNFGPLRPNQNESEQTWRSYAAQVIADRRNDLPYGIEAGLTNEEAAGLLAIVDTLPDFPCPQPVLCHGDLSADHLFVDDRLNLAGIIDFGMCQGGPGLVDFAVLLMFHMDIDVEWLANGYGETLGSTADFQSQLIAHQVNIGMSYLAQDTREGNQDSREIALQSLRAWLHSWRELRRRS